MLEKLSIEWKLPLAISAVLMAVLAGLFVLVNEEVGGSTERAVGERVENFANQLAGTFQASVDKGLVRLSTAVRTDALGDYLRAPERTESLAREARAALEDMLGPSEDFAAIQLWSLDGRELIAVGPDRERIADVPLDVMMPASAPATGGAGAVFQLDGRVVVPAFVPVPSAEEPLGYVVRWSSIPMSAATREQVTGFLAPEASAFLGTPGGPWIDWERVVPEPELDLTRLGSTTRLERPAGAHLVAAARVTATPWIVVVEYPERLALAPARRLFARVGAAAILLLLAGAGGVWLVARRITVRLRELTLASESLVEDSRADATAAGQDELARLGTSFQRMSERVREAHRGLEAKVGELRTAQEREHLARAHAEEANSRKDEFLAMLAHELRNPLSPIVCALAVIRSSRASDSQREEALAVIERQALNMTRIVDDLLDVSRITRGKVTLQRRAADVGALVRNAIETSRPLIEAKQHRVVCSVPEEPLRVDLDATRMEQVLGNLVTNAAKYTEPGGRIWVSAAREGDDVAFRVRDDGIGIPPDKLLRIFDLFHQVDHSIDRSRGGLGIGLTLARKLVELHGGTVTASSAGSGQGSEFVVRLPARSCTAQDPEREPLDGPVELHPLRILVVEDARDSRELLACVLELDGHEVVTAGDGHEGFARFQSFDPDVVVLDIGLPGMDGFELARRIRAEGGEDVLLVAATGYGDGQTRARAREVGIDAHVVKPIARSELSTILARGGRRDRASPAVAAAEGERVETVPCTRARTVRRGVRGAGPPSTAV